MNKPLKNLLTAALMSLSIVGSGHATSMLYTVESISGPDWRYLYTIENNTLLQTIDEFTLYFDRTRYANLAVQSSPSNWDSLVVQPDDAIPADGYFDSLSLIEGIAPGASLSGFSVMFTYLGSDTPGPQPFDIVDASFNVIDSGVSTPVPEPTTAWLFVGGLLMLLGRKTMLQKSSRPSLT